MLRLSEKAREDLRSIAQFTRRTWGQAQAIRYIRLLRDRCQRLNENPALGRIAHLQPSDLRRFEEGSHVIFYLSSEEGVVVTRILHKNMLPGLHVLE